MPVRQEALRVNQELAIAPLGDDGQDAIGRFLFQRTARSDDRNAHARAYEASALVSAMGGSWH
jgi:hypothetical protein